MRKPYTNVFTKKTRVSGIITIKPHRQMTGKGIVLDFIMAVPEGNNDNL